MKKLSVVCAFSLAVVSSAYGLTLKESVNQTISKNHEIISNNYDIQAKDKAVDLEKTSYYPRVDLSSSLESSKTKDELKNSTTASEWENVNGHRSVLSAEQLLYDGGKTSSKIDEKQFNYESSSFNRDYSNDNVVLNVVKTYLKLSELNELNQVNEFNFEAYKSSLDISKKQEEISGELLDSKKVLSLFSSFNDKKMIQSNEYKNVTSEFLKLTNLDSVDFVCRTSFDESIIPNTFDAYVQNVLANNLRIQEQERIIKEQATRIDQELAGYLPDLKLRLEGAYDKDIELDGNGTQKDLTAKILLNWNFYSGGATKIGSERERILFFKERETLEKIKSDVIEEAKKAYENYVSNKSRLDNMKENLEVELAILDITTKQLEDGTKTFLDELIAKNKVYETQSNIIKLEHTLAGDYYELLNISGGLSKAILNSNDSNCSITKLDDITGAQNVQANDDLLSSSLMLNESPAMAESNGDLTDEFEMLFETSGIFFNKEDLSVIIPVSAKSFTIPGINYNDSFKNKLDLIAKNYANLLKKYGNEIRGIMIESHTSSEFRAAKNVEEAKQGNLALSQRRSIKTKDYLLSQLVKNGFDSRSKAVVATGFGSNNLIFNDNGKEDVNSSRRVVIRLVK